MTPQEFCYWLQGFFELSDAKILTEQQVKTIENHLNLVDVTVSAHNASITPTKDTVTLRC